MLVTNKTEKQYEKSKKSWFLEKIGKLTNPCQIDGENKRDQEWKRDYHFECYKIL